MDDDLELTPEAVSSTENFLKALLEADRSGFYPGEAQVLAKSLNRPLPEVMQELKGWGLTVLTHQRRR
jgi:hypothetical protein